MEESELVHFARTFQRLMEAVTGFVAPDDGVALRSTLESHLGREVQELPAVADHFPGFEHVNVQVALDALLCGPGRSHQLLGLLGDQHSFMSFADLATNAQRRGVSVGAVDYVSLPDGPASTRLCVQAGLYLAYDDGVPVAVLLRGPNEHGPQQAVSVEVLAGDRAHGERLVAELRRLVIERSVFRNQVLTFTAGPFGQHTAGPIVFQPRPRLARDDVVLPDHTFTEIEEHVFGIAEHRERLRASGQHLKRGLLLYGPPGTGKTLTTRYLIARLVDHTIVVLSGPALQYVAAAATLARSLQPALVVLEDVDLVANQRMPHLGQASPLLFELLNVMDGLDEDADLTFLLTTNRADVLEPALAARPGRVDQAVEIPLPDPAGRQRLLQLYGAGVDLRLEDTASVLARTEGVTASFIKELVRKAALEAARTDRGDGRLTVTDAHVASALDVLLDEGAGLTRALLGISRGAQVPEGAMPAPAVLSYAPLNPAPSPRFSPGR